MGFPMAGLGRRTASRPGGWWPSALISALRRHIVNDGDNGDYANDDRYHGVARGGGSRLIPRPARDLVGHSGDAGRHLSVGFSACLLVCAEHLTG
jgi:hypothetical protein